MCANGLVRLKLDFLIQNVRLLPDGLNENQYKKYQYSSFCMKNYTR